MSDAAEAIEQLQGENTKLREALERIANGSIPYISPGEGTADGFLRDIAAEALKDE